jgi:hypothetical protein
MTRPEEMHIVARQRRPASRESQILISGKAYWIKASARLDGTFTVTNAQNGFSKTD